jgi:phosphomannomutase/phosphoglucomutase
MHINPDIFREFSIRGIANSELTNDVVMAIGRAIGTHFNHQGHPLLVVGRDVRSSSTRIGQTLIEGLLQTGLNVIDVGLVPTPLHNFATDFYQAAGGVMVTASHNPPEYNGFKIRADESLTGQTLRQIYQLATAGNFAEGQGTISQKDALPAYVSALHQHAQASRPLKIVVDGGNGTNGTVVADLLGQQGHTIIELFTQPDGTFPHRNPDPTAKGALSMTAQTVVDQQADCGLAYDGDGDRVVLIDEQGGVHFGDIILMLLARQAAQQGPFKVVYDISSTKALADDIIAHGGEAYPAPVGYTFIHHKMKEIGANLGGETAGHIFCLDNRFRFDDAILASIKLLNYITAQNQPVSRLIAALPRYYTSPNYRLFCPDELKAVVIQNLTTTYQMSHPVDTTDGVKIMFEHGWALIRQSNTQPALTFRVEGETIAEKERLEQAVRPVVEQELAKLGVET